MGETYRTHDQIVGRISGGLERGKFAEPMPRAKPSNLRGREPRQAFISGASFSSA